MISHVKTRLGHRLYQRDKDTLKQALLDYCLDNDLEAKEVPGDDYLIDAVLPYAARIDEHWTGLNTCIEFRASAAGEHMKEYLKNQIRQKGKYLDQKIKKAKAQCSVNGKRLKGKEKAANCGISINKKSKKATVKATPNCGAGMKIKITIVAKAPGEEKAKWTRTWKVQRDSNVPCTLRGTG